MHPDLAPEDLKRFAHDVVDVMKQHGEKVEWMAFDFEKQSGNIRLIILWPDILVGKQRFAGTFTISRHLIGQPTRAEDFAMGDALNSHNHDLLGMALIANFLDHRTPPEEMARQQNEYQQRVEMVAANFIHQKKAFMKEL